MSYASDNASRGVTADRQKLARTRAHVARVMACVLSSAVMIGTANAADLDDSFLRGSLLPPTASPAYADWRGVYVGGQFGVSSGIADFSNGLSSLTGYILRDTVLEGPIGNLKTMGSETTTHGSYGAFIGYNFYDVDKIVLGVEGTYTRLNMDSGTSDSLTRVIQNDAGATTGHHYFYTTTVSGNASVRIKDFATVRARAGWQTGQFLPYAFVGAAFGRADYARSATVSYTKVDKPDAQLPPIPPDPTTFFNTPPGSDPAGTKSDSQENAMAYGLAAGLGVDVSILPNVFLRAEWEYVKFAPIHDINVSINTGRVGIGVKF